MRIVEADRHADKFPASAAFVDIDEALNASEADRKDAIKQANAIFGFTLTNPAGDKESWHIDLKNTGRVGKGLGDAKPTGACSLSSQHPSEVLLTGLIVTLLLSDADFGNLVSGKGSAQRLFMGGKLKIQGDMMKATKLEAVLNKTRTKAKL